MIDRGVLIDQAGNKAAEALFKQLRADLRSIEGRRIMAVLNQLVVGYVPPISHVTKPDSTGALIALEACRNFVREIEAIAAHDDRPSDNRDEHSGSGRKPRARPGSS